MKQSTRTARPRIARFTGPFLSALALVALACLSGCRVSNTSEVKQHDTVLVPGGHYLDDQGARHDVVTLAVDETEVTVDDYKECVKAGRCSSDIRMRSVDFETCLKLKKCRPRERLTRCNWHRRGQGPKPMNCVGIAQAIEYCKWRNQRLPSEWEWEWIARGGPGSRRFPWGSQSPDCARIVMAHADLEGIWAGCKTGTTWPVGSKPNGASAHGVLDLAGNVAEFTFGDKDGTFTVRGGSYSNDGDVYFEASNRSHAAEFFKEYPFSGADSETGFRCVAPVPAVE